MKPLLLVLATSAVLAAAPASASALVLRLDATETRDGIVARVSGDRAGGLRIDGERFWLHLRRRTVTGRVDGTALDVTGGCPSARGTLDADFDGELPTRLRGRISCGPADDSRPAARVRDVRASGDVGPIAPRRSAGVVRGIAGRRGVVVTGGGFEYFDAKGSFTVRGGALSGTGAYRGITAAGQLAYAVTRGRFTLRGRLRW